jgi:3-oxoacyl-[acyl-carrier protein] reductase
MDLGLNGKVAMISAASKGLGFAVARALAAEGASVSISSSNATSLQAAKASIERDSNRAILDCVADVRSGDAIEKWYETTVQRFGGVDLLFVNSGGPPAGGFMSFDDKAWQDAVDLLLLSAVRMVRTVLPSLKQRGGGSVVFTASSSVKEPIENLTLSNVVRATVPALSKSLAREFAVNSIRFNTLVPGRIDTGRVRSLDAFNAQKKNIPVEDQRRLMQAAIPLGRYGEVEEYARAAVFLLSPASSYVTGAVLQVDGGMIRSVM